MSQISVIVPLYNHGSYITTALNSVLAQTSPADEILVIDDGSQDSGAELAAQVLRHRPDARVIRQSNRGAHNTLNRLVEECCGDYVAILNSDDVFLPHKIENCKAVFDRSPNVELVCGKVQLIDASDREVETGVTVEWLTRADDFLKKSKLPQLAILNENFIATTSNMVFSRALWRRCSGFQNLRYCHDLDFLMAAFKFGTVFIDEERAHIKYRLHEANTIKEDLGLIRLELASVIAAALYESGSSIIAHRLSVENVSAFFSFLDNKGMTKLVCFLQMLRTGFMNRSLFYEHLADTNIKNKLREFIA